MSEHIPMQEDINRHLEALQEAWDWLTKRGISLRQTNTLQWTVEKRIALSISTSTYPALLEALTHHGVTLEEGEGALRAIFPEDTKKVPQPDLPGTYLLILPDGWSVQEMPLRHRLPYSSVLVASSSEKPAPGAVWTVGSPGETFP